MSERPQKRRRLQDFIEHEATVARDEEEEEYGEEEGGKYKIFEKLIQF